MCYRIIITSNGKKKRILDKSNNISNIKKKYYSIVDRNKVLFPKQTSAYLKTKPVKYEILLLKKWEENDTPYIDRDEMGRTIEIEDTNKKWTIIEKVNSHLFYAQTKKQHCSSLFYSHTKGQTISE